MRAKPRARILLVRVFRKAGIWKEVARCPLPHAPEHLIATAVSCRNFPFKFCRKTAASPTAVSVSFKPRDIRDRPVQFERNPLIEVTAEPSAACIAPPVMRMRRAGVFDVIQK